MEKGNLHADLNKELAKTLNPYIEYCQYFFMVFRALFILISLKKPSICKATFYSELLYDIILRVTPIEIEWSVYMWGMTFKILILFTLHYFEFWSCLLAIITHVAL